MTITNHQQLVDAIVADVKTRVSEFHTYQEHGIINWFNRTRIVHPITGLTNIRARGYQHDLLLRLNKHQNIVLNTARQLGSTHVLAAFALWRALQRPGERIFIVTDKFDRMKNIHDRIEKMFDQLAWTRHGSHGMKFENGSIIGMDTAKKSTTSWVGVETDLLIFDNAAYISHKVSHDLWMELIPTMHPNGQIIVSSTPSNQDGLFWDLWNQVPTLMVPVSWPWTVNPELDAVWAAHKRAALGNDVFAREYECQFSPAPSANPVI